MLPDPLAPYDFELPDAQIARFPPDARDAGRLLVLAPDRREDRRVVDLPSLLRPGDLLVYNDVHVQRARLFATRRTGGRVEVLLAMPLEDGAWAAILRPVRRLSPGEVLSCGPGSVAIEARLDELLWRVQVRPDAATVCEAVGEIPLPPYLDRAPTPADAERYQTVYHRRGPLEAAAAPTAGLHFTAALLEALAARGVERAPVTLAVGPGTFLPLRDRQLAEGRLHVERFVVPEATWAAVTRARAEGRRVVAVGTTSARVLEAAAGPGLGATDLFIREGYRFRTVDVLFTNFHLPRSSLLMLVASFGGRERVLAAYQHAVAAGYRFYSYGDAMLVEPDHARPGSEDP